MMVAVPVTRTSPGSSASLLRTTTQPSQAPLGPPAEIMADRHQPDGLGEGQDRPGPTPAHPDCSGIGRLTRPRELIPPSLIGRVSDQGQIEVWRTVRPPDRASLAESALRLVHLGPRCCESGGIAPGRPNRPASGHETLNEDRPIFRIQARVRGPPQTRPKSSLNHQIAAVGRANRVMLARLL